MSGMTTKRRHSNSCSGAPTTVVNPEGGGSMIDNAQLKRHSLGSTLSRCNSADNSAPFLQQVRIFMRSNVGTHLCCLLPICLLKRI